MRSMEEMIERKDVWRSLKTTFTEKEKLIMAESIASCIRERNRLEDEFASIKKQYASDIGKQEAEISSLAERFNTGWEMRRVECEEVKDFNNGTVTVYRKDQRSGYLLDPVEERALTAEERQLNLPLDEKTVAEQTNFPPQTSQDAPGQEIMGQDVSEQVEISKDLVEGMAETAEIINKNLGFSDLPDDDNDFYTQKNKASKSKKTRVGK